jgi:outer membrane biosynthesis protein TonB
MQHMQQQEQPQRLSPFAFLQAPQPPLPLSLRFGGDTGATAGPSMMAGPARMMGGGRVGPAMGPTSHLKLFFADDDNSVLPLARAGPAMGGGLSSSFPFPSLMMRRIGMAPRPLFSSLLSLAAPDDDEKEEDEEMPPCMACAEDLEKFCGEVLAAHPDEMVQGSFEMQMCLMRRKEAISSQCLASLSHDENLVTMCYSDIDEHCSGITPGNSKIHTCLKEHKAKLEAGLSESCSRQVDRAALRLAQSNPSARPAPRQQQRPQPPPQQQQQHVEDEMATLDGEMNSMVSMMDFLFGGPRQPQPPQPEKKPAAEVEKKEEEPEVEMVPEEEDKEEAKKPAAEASATEEPVEEKEEKEEKAPAVAEKAPRIAQIAKVAAEMKAKRSAAKPTARETAASNSNPNPNAAPAAELNEGAEEAAGFADFLLKNEKVRHAASLTAAALGVVSLLVLGSISHRASVTARQRREREAFRRSYAPGMI